MKITKSQLKEIIKEEIEAASTLNEGPALDIRTAAATFGGTAAGSGWLLTVGLRVGCRPKSLRGSSRDSERQIGIPTSKPEPVAATPISSVST